jgi:anti-sigma B factor antagonist
VDAFGDDMSLLREQPVRDIAEQDGVVLVRLRGELDVYNAGLVREALVDATGRGGSRVVIDLSEVSFVDSTLLGVFVEARTHVSDRRAFLLAAAGLEVRRALEISGLDRHFELHDSVDSALAAKLVSDAV